jgi:hypothetical protein
VAHKVKVFFFSFSLGPAKVACVLVVVVGVGQFVDVFVGCWWSILGS